MTAPLNETDARILIDDLLRAAGWNPADKSRVRTEVLVKPVATASIVRETSPDYGSDASEVTAAPGRVDYVLYSSNGRPLALVEAKRRAISPYTAKQQALPYAKQLGAPFIFLTN